MAPMVWKDDPKQHPDLQAKSTAPQGDANPQ